MAEGALLAVSVAHLADHAGDGDELRGDSQLGLGLAPLDTVHSPCDARESIEKLVAHAGNLAAHACEPLMQPVQLVANALQNLDGDVRRFHARRLPP